MVKTNYKETHYKLDHDGQKVWCIRCKKVVEERDSLPDYAMFMGGVWRKQNLPCKKVLASKDVSTRRREGE